MTQNPYQPPSAEVADRLSSAPPVRPRQVGVATALLWISLALGVPTMYLTMARDTDTGFQPLFIALIVILFAIAAFVNVQVHRGRNWARIVVLIMTILSAMVLLFPGEEAVPPGVLENVLNVASLLLEIAAAYLLYSHPGKLWFRPRD